MNPMPKHWRKEPPDVPGMWLAAFWSKGRWWTDILHVIQHGTPKRADATWWYLGPFELPNDPDKDGWLLSLETRVTRYKAEDGRERAVILWEDYERLLRHVRERLVEPPFVE